MTKDYSSRPSWQYNAVMLVRILTDNPGPTFTRHLDQKFVETTKSLLRNSRDPSVRQILAETLEDFERNRTYDKNLQGLVAMWQREKEKSARENGGRIPYIPPNMPPPMQSHMLPPTHGQNYFARQHQGNRLPEPVELASRLEEARTSAKLLEQVVMNTPASEILDNELIKEFAERCQSASRSIQGYMTCENPAPDNDTMESLIDTNEQLQTALNQHQRAVLSARKQLEGLEAEDSATNGGRSSYNDDTDLVTPISPVSTMQPVNKGKGREVDAYEAYEPPAGPPPGPSAGRAPRADDGDDPFADPFKDPQRDRSRDGFPSGDYHEDRLAYEPFNPGFGSADKGKSPAAGGSGANAKHPYDMSESDGYDDDDDIYRAGGNGKQPASKV
ncbi:hypothetical protein B0I35DRAFT_93495 [Stachybotrys elegans]|uniref:GAT domain-containing protein n=1 Tax=Stachybotrys elegans TaxID=80388 RepID=A0A8K0SDM8_9HYPO|nr:hypothetical protein B0I35DRAFT_93495 [Stachybotrys elegans]